MNINKDIDKDFLSGEIYIRINNTGDKIVMSDEDAYQYDAPEEVIIGKFELDSKITRSELNELLGFELPINRIFVDLQFSKDLEIWNDILLKFTNYFVRDMIIL